MEWKNKNVLITGAAGFIGQHLAHRLIREGASVSGLDLARPANGPGFPKFKSWFQGDLTDENTVEPAMAGIDVVFHTAAVVEESGSMDFFRKINVGGTQLVAQCADQAGAQAFVQLSSVMVYGFDFPEYVAENGPMRGEGNPYCQTKIESEAVLHAADFKNLNYVIIRPGDVYGPGSMPWVVRPLRLMKKGMFALPAGAGGVMNHVHVSNLIDGMLLAVEKEAWGEAFNLTDGARTPWSEYFSRLARTANLRAPLHIPEFLLHGLFMLLKPLAAVGLPIEVPHADAINFIKRPYPYSIRKAKEQLGYSPRIGLDEGMQELKTWLDTDANALN